MSRGRNVIRLAAHPMEHYRVGQWVFCNRQVHKHAYTGQVQAIIDTPTSKFLVINDHHGEPEHRHPCDVHIITNLED